MVERKAYKTKLCALYKRGYCNRRSCWFAHGEAELRRSSGSSSGGRDYRGRDSRSRSGRSYSPLRKCSPIKDARRHHTFQRRSRSRSIEDSRKRQKSQSLDDVSGRSSDGKDCERDGKSTSSDSKHTLMEQLQSKIDDLEKSKVQMETDLEQRTQETDILASKVVELEEQLLIEREHRRRSDAKIEKFLEAQRQYLWLQEEINRTWIQLQNLGDELALDVSEGSNGGEGFSINVVSVSDEENTNDHASSLRTELQFRSSPKTEAPDLNEVASDDLQIDGRMTPLYFAGMSHLYRCQFSGCHCQFAGSYKYKGDLENADVVGGLNHTERMSETNTP